MKNILLVLILTVCSSKSFSQILSDQYFIFMPSFNQEVNIDYNHLEIYLEKNNIDSLKLEPYKIPKLFKNVILINNYYAFPKKLISSSTNLMLKFNSKTIKININEIATTTNFSIFYLNYIGADSTETIISHYPILRLYNEVKSKNNTIIWNEMPLLNVYDDILLHFENDVYRFYK